jgi:hypothetical protein
MARLERSSLEAYGGIAIAIVSAVFTLTWYIKFGLLLILAGIIIDLSWRSPWTIGITKGVYKWLICMIGLTILLLLSWTPLRKQYDEETKTGMPLRNLSDDQRKYICEHLPALVNPGRPRIKLRVFYMPNDSDANQYAVLLEAALVNCQVVDVTDGDPTAWWWDRRVVGVKMLAKSPSPWIGGFQQILLGAGITAPLVELPQDTPYDLALYVGAAK